MVFGLTPSLPSVLTDTAASAGAREQGLRDEEPHEERLRMARKARAAFLEAETSTKIRRAIANPIRSDKSEQISVGDYVLFWNESVDKTSSGWKGPARVTAVDHEAKTIQMAHGSQYVTRHATKVRLESDAKQEGLNKAEMSEEEISKLATRGKIEVEDIIDWQKQQGQEQTDVVDQIMTQSDEHQEATKLSRAEKSLRDDGISKYWSTDNAVHHGRQRRPPTKFGFEENLMAVRAWWAKEGASKIKKVLKKDLQPGTQLIGSRFVYTWKEKGEETKNTKVASARLVALGNQEDVDDEWVDAPTGTREGCRVMLSEAVQRGWEIQQDDAKRAFLLLLTIYGLRSAPKVWWLTIKSVLIEANFQQCVNDPAMFKTQGQCLSAKRSIIFHQILVGNQGRLQQRSSKR
eukprot:c20442_g1_i5.p1 GENE.c20442_g1_i5~~c20442_g1_i5.p1  ORF type:complete len:405 (-),score=53.24 c20442_g1_i5:434-1648(-)